MAKILSTHKCLFCKKEQITLTEDKHEQKCSCGIRYEYRPVAATLSGMTLKQLNRSKHH
jgi:hypothetical protein